MFKRRLHAFGVKHVVKEPLRIRVTLIGFLRVENASTKRKFCDFLQSINDDIVSKFKK